ncbi:MAG: pitrilysin family protein [bacterium]
MKLINLRNSFNIFREKLNNGLDIVLVPINKSPVVCVNMAYRVGSKDERFDRTGMAHLFEHLMFEGTSKNPKGEFDKLCSLAGGTNNAYTSFDLTNYYMSLPANQLELGLWLEADRLKNFQITQEALQNQQNVVIEEINQTVEDQPYGLWRDLMSENAYSPKSSYSWEVYGSKEHVAKVSLEDAEAFRKLYYQPDNACLLVVGDFGLDIAKELINKHFSELIKPVREIKRNIFLPKHLIHEGYQSFEDDVPTPAVFLAYHIEGFTNEKSYAGDIVANILGVGKSSRLWKKLVIDKQIANEVGAYIDKREHSSLLIIYAFANTPNISCNQLYDEINSTIQEIKSNSITDDEMQKSINQLSSQMAFEIESFSGLAETIAQFAVFMDDPEKIFTNLDIYSKFSKSDIHKYIQKIFGNGTGVRIDAIPQ